MESKVPKNNFSQLVVVKDISLEEAYQINEKKKKKTNKQRDRIKL